MEEVGGGSPTLALKIKGSPSTGGFKLCFKAQQHPLGQGYVILPGAPLQEELLQIAL